MNITSGKIKSAQKIVIYGPEGIGKTTFAAQFPNPVFSDTEGSTKHIDVRRFEKPKSWAALMEQAKYVLTVKPCKTYVVDTMDWAERLCVDSICAKYKKSGLESFGYGNGYVYLMEEVGRFLNILGEIVEEGINVVLTAHAFMRKFEEPDEMGSYDRWELKLTKKVAPIVKEWADMILFANYKTYVVAADDSNRKFKAQGGKRIMYTTHHPCWDAKNRHDLEDELPFEYAAIRHCIEETDIKNESAAIPARNTEPAAIPQQSTPETAERPTVPEELTERDFEKPAGYTEKYETKPEEFVIGEEVPNQKLVQLMTDNKVTGLELRRAIAYKGHFPDDTPISTLPPDYVDGVLIGAWDQVYDVVKDMRKEYLF